jgi:hypothetical protein
VSNDIKNLWEQDLVYAAYCEQATTRQQEAFHEMVSRLYARIARIARLEAVATAAEDVYATMARQDVTADELMVPMARLREALDAAKEGT